MTDPNELRALLAGYTGCEQPYRHSLVRSFFYTDGVRAFAQNAGHGAYWLLDILATEPAIRKGVEEEGFAVVVLKVNEDKTARLVVAYDTTSDGTDYEGVVHSQHLSFTDCPPGEWKFYMEPTVVGNAFGVMLMLPGER